MSKEAAMKLLGADPTTAKPSLITPEVSPGSTEVASPEAPKDELQSSRLAILAKKETAIQKEREAIKKEREDFAKERAESDAYRNRGKQFDETFAKDKKAALKLLGFTDTDIANIMADSEPKEETVEDKARKIAAEETQKIREELAKEKTDNENARNKRLVDNLKTNIKDTIKKEAEKYEFCAFDGEDAEAEAYNIIVKELKDSGNLLTVNQALDIHEETLEALEKERQKIIKKLQIKPPEELAPTSTKEGKPLVSNVPTKPKTLTNNIAPTTAAAAAPRSETPQQKKERLVQALLALGKS